MVAKKLPQWSARKKAPLPKVLADGGTARYFAIYE